MSEFVDAKQLSHSANIIPNDLALDHSKYLPDLDGMGVSEDGKRELLEVLWDIMRMFVELGYSVDVREQALIEIFNNAAHGDVGLSGQP